MTATRTPNHHRLIRGLGSLAALLAVVLGVPALLIRVHAAPHSTPTLHQLTHTLTSPDQSGHTFTTIAAGVVWIAWATFTLATLKEAASAIRGVRPRVVATGWRALTPAALVTSISLLIIAPTVLTATAPHAAAESATAHPSARPAAATSAAASEHPTAAHAAQPPTYQVQRYDTLWTIAQRHLPGDPAQRYHDIARLNPELVAPDNQIQTGTTLTLPHDATGLNDRTQPQADGQVTVQAGDTLSGIATAHGITDWHTLWPANHNRPEPDGAQFIDPNQIEPGWTVQLPTPEHPAATHHPAAPVAVPAPRPANHPPPLADPDTALTEPAPATAPAPASSTRASSSVQDLQRVFEGGGLLLAAGALATFTAHRRSQRRHRRPGRDIARMLVDLRPTENALRTHGSVAAADVTFLDHALRSLATGHHAGAGLAAPMIAAAELTDHQLNLHLQSPALHEPPAPWSSNDAGTCWSVHTNDELPVNAANASSYLAPLPTLVAIAHEANGNRWLLNLETASTIHITGDPEAATNLAHFIAAELAVNQWARDTTVTLAGLPEQLAALNPDRLHHTKDVGSAVDALVAHMQRVREASVALSMDPLSGRLADVAGDSWAPHVLMIAATDLPLSDEAKLGQLTEAFLAVVGGAACLILVGAGGDATPTAIQLTVEANRRLSGPGLPTDLIAEGLPTQQIQDLAQLIHAAIDTTDRPMPSATGGRRIDQLTDVAGALRPEHTIPRHIPTTDLPPQEIEAESSTAATQSLLPADDDSYRRGGAATTEDLDTLAPHVPATVSERVLAADPNLDIDLRDWRDPDSTTPKLTLLGPVRLRAHGTPPAKRIAYYTELAAYLATREHGATADQLATAFNVSVASLYSRITSLRNWLGTDPDGSPYLPDSTRSAGSRARGVGVYQLDRILVDADLFRRLRTRGQAIGGTDGINYLEAALSLVDGAPFDQLRAGGYGWLADNPLDHQLTSAIVDTAHMVHLHYLHAGDVDQARRTAELAITAAPFDDVPKLDLAAAMLAQGNASEADRCLREALCDEAAGVDEPADPPERSSQLFRVKSRD